MPYISLSANTKKNPYNGQADILEKDYGPCKVFKKYEHKPRDGTYIKPGEITVYKDYSNSYSSSFTINTTGKYSSVSLDYEEVYFNKYDKTQKRLVLVLHFKSGLKSKYLRLSRFDDLFGVKFTKNISDLDDCTDENSILNVLLEENDRLNNLLTFRIDIKENKNYNGDKITVKKDTTHSKKIGDEFIVYKHEPKPISGKTNVCFLYKNQVLMKKDGNELKMFDDDEDSKYDYVNMYWSNGIVCEPLLLELHENLGSSQDNTIKIDIFISRRDGEKIYFEKLDHSFKNFTEIGLKSSSEIYTLFLENKTELLLSVLRNLQSVFVKTIFIMLDKKHEYGDTDVTTGFNDSSKYRLLNNDSNKIPVYNRDAIKGSCSKKYGYKIYEHDLAGLFGEIYPKNEQVDIKFILSSEDKHGKYVEISLYDDDNNKCKMYNKKGRDLANLYVYFYGEDPRPLLVTYNKYAYKPKDKKKYNTEWVRVKGVNDCHLGGNNYELIKNLSKVVGFLNEVKLEKTDDAKPHEKHGEKSSINITYNIHQYNGKTFKIDASYKNKNCYRVYTHTHKNGSGYRLGNIVYNDSILEYSSEDELRSVSVYYNVCDYKHQYPLIVVLKFNGTIIECYKLTKKSEPYTWKLVDKPPANLETLAYSVKYDLGISFDGNKSKGQTLFNPDNCYEDSSNVGGALTGVGMAGGALGFGGYVCYRNIDKIRAVLSRFHR